MIAADDAWLVTLGGDGIDSQTETLIKLPEEARVRQQHAATLRLSYETTVPQIKMIVSNWYTDELGNQARFIKACD
jgi:hypothetical protein